MAAVAKVARRPEQRRPRSCGELVEAGRHAAEGLERVEAPLDEVARSAEIGRDGAPDAHVAAGRTVRPRPAPGTRIDQPLGAVTPVGDDAGREGQAVEEHRSCRLVRGVTGRHHEADRQARLVDDGMGPCRQSRMGTADGVIRAPCRRRRADGPSRWSCRSAVTRPAPCGRAPRRSPARPRARPFRRRVCRPSSTGRDAMAGRARAIRCAEPSRPLRPRRSSTCCHPGGTGGKISLMSDRSTSLRSYRATNKLPTDETLHHLRGALGSLDHGFGT